jgi:hypothetical protein
MVGASEYPSNVSVNGARERVIPNITLFILSVHLCPRPRVVGDGPHEPQKINH